MDVTFYSKLHILSVYDFDFNKILPGKHESGMFVQQDKSPTENCCHVLFMTCWHKFQMIINSRFIMSRQTLAVAAQRM